MVADDLVENGAQPPNLSDDDMAAMIPILRRSLHVDFEALEQTDQKDRQKPITTMFRSVCVAKVPESLIELAPERSRFIPSAYLHIKANSLAHVVSTKIAGKEHTFQAEVKVMDKLLWDASLAPSVLQDLGKPIDVPALDGGMHPAKPLDDEVRTEESLPSTGRPPQTLGFGTRSNPKLRCVQLGE